MNELLAAILPLFLVVIGFAVILGLPLGRVLKGAAKWVMILSLIAIVAVQGPALLDYLSKHPPRSLQELAVWVGIGFLLFLAFLRIAFGQGAISRFFERIITSVVYDMLKALVRLLTGRRP